MYLFKKKLFINLWLLSNSSPYSLIIKVIRIQMRFIDAYQKSKIQIVAIISQSIDNAPACFLSMNNLLPMLFCYKTVQYNCIL